PSPALQNPAQTPQHPPPPVPPFATPQPYGMKHLSRMWRTHSVARALVPDASRLLSTLRVRVTVRERSASSPAYAPHQPRNRALHRPEYPPTPASPRSPPP